MRIYFDENFSHRIASGMREFQSAKPSEGVTTVWCPEEFGKGAADEDWIPKIASKHGIILTQDQNIHRTRAQWELCQHNKLGVFFFKPPPGRLGPLGDRAGGGEPVGGNQTDRFKPKTAFWIGGGTAE